MLTWEMIYPRLEEEKPLVQCITNIVTVNDCANALLAVGASPTMAHGRAEAAEVAAGCAALVCNLGATADYRAMERACAAARRLGHPVVLDPVGAGGSGPRRRMARKLLRKGYITCVRGNAAEIRALARDEATRTGVDAGEEGDETAVGASQRLALAEELARRYGILVVLSGAQDVIADGNTAYTVDNGSVYMTRVTGCGCMASALLGAWLAAADRTASGASPVCGYPEAAAELMSVFGICGELAQERLQTEGGGTMTFHLWLLDGLSGLNEDIIRNREKIKKLK